MSTATVTTQTCALPPTVKESYPVHSADGTLLGYETVLRTQQPLDRDTTVSVELS